VARARERLRLRLGRRGFALSGSLLGALLAPDRLAAAVPSALAHGTLTGVCSLLNARTAAIATQVVTLYREVSNAMLMTRVKKFAAVVLLGLAALGAGLFGLQAHAAREGPAAGGPSPGKGVPDAGASAKGRKGGVLPSPGDAKPGGKDKATIPGKGKGAKEVPFTAVALYGTGMVVVRHTGKHSVRIKVGDGSVPDRGARVEKGTLTLGLGALPAGVSPLEAEYLVEIKELKGLYLIGTGNMEATGVKTRALKVAVAGMGQVTVAGSADVLDLTLTGTGNFRGEGLRAKRATVQHKGIGDAVVYVSGRLDATVTGIGKVEYLGSPAVRRTVTGLGTVRPKR
jgi:hypothetical protein